MSLSVLRSSGLQNLQNFKTELRSQGYFVSKPLFLCILLPMYAKSFFFSREQQSK